MQLKPLLQIGEHFGTEIKLRKSCPRHCNIIIGLSNHLITSDLKYFPQTHCLNLTFLKDNGALWLFLSAKFLQHMPVSSGKSKMTMMKKVEIMTVTARCPFSFSLVIFLVMEYCFSMIIYTGLFIIILCDM